MNSLFPFSDSFYIVIGTKSCKPVYLTGYSSDFLVEIPFPIVRIYFWLKIEGFWDYIIGFRILL